MSSDIPVPVPQEGEDAENPLRQGHTQVHLPRITIKFCTQCKWMLRAAYFAQELLSTFSTALGEVSLIPCTGGIFTVTILHASTADFTAKESILWDRKTEGGFPDVKQLKALVRDIIDPSRSLGHIDRANAKAKDGKASGTLDTPVDASAGDTQPSSTQGVDSSPSKTLPTTDTTSEHTPSRSPREEKAESGRGIMGEGKENDTSAMEGEVCEDC